METDATDSRSVIILWDEDVVVYEALPLPIECADHTLADNECER
ncbi:hypothetical protein [Natrinema salinisoli]|nr:hypothetical protein [Natrinema salinisoli]